MSKDRLKVWYGRGTKAWDVLIIAAYTLADAAQLYVEAEGDAEDPVAWVRDHYSMATEIPQAYRRVVFNVQRGCYLVDSAGASVMFLPSKSRAIIDEVPEDAVAAATGQQVPEGGYGILNVDFQRGVRIGVWTYTSPHHDRAHADKLTCEVRLRNADRERRQYGNSGDAGMEFVATSKCWEGELQSPDINTLFDEAQKAFQTFDLGRRGIVWEDWLEVEIEPCTSSFGLDETRGDKQRGLALTYKHLKRGVDPRDGTVYTLHDGFSVMPFPKPKAAGVEEGGKFHGRDTDHQFAYLPATPENEAALERVCEKLDELRIGLERLLSQDVIAKELAGVAGLLRLQDRSA